MKVKVIKLFSVLFIGALFLINSSCNESNQAKPVIMISPEFLSYSYFLEDSWWLIQNDSTMATDTIKITEIKDAIRYAPTPVPHNYQAVDMFLNNNIFQINRYEITAGSEEVTEGNMNSLLRMYFQDGSYQVVFSPKYPIGEEVILGAEIGVYKNVEILENLDLLNNSYEDVWVVKVIVESNNAEFNYWIAKNHGLIKYHSIIEGQSLSLSLVDSNLISE